jgi:hypothetical protein
MKPTQHHIFLPNSKRGILLREKAWSLYRQGVKHEEIASIMGIPFRSVVGCTSVMNLIGEYLAWECRRHSECKLKALLPETSVVFNE